MSSLFSQATVLEEMPPFPERESSILAKLKKKKGPGAVSVTELEDNKREGGELNGGGDRGPDTSAMAASNAVSSCSQINTNMLKYYISVAPTPTVLLFSSQLRHHQQTSSGFVLLLPSALLQPVPAACWWTCSLRQGPPHLQLL